MQTAAPKSAARGSSARPLGRRAVLRSGSFGLQRASPSVVVVRASSAAPAEPAAPSRGVLLLPGLGNNAADYGPLAALLEARGMAVEVAQVSRLDWSRNAAALTDPNWWRGTLQPRPAVDWYLAAVDGAMSRLKRRLEAEAPRGDGGAPISLLTHSAGGWLGRVYLLHWGAAGVERYVSLGSPQAPPPAGVLDQTRGILTHCQQACPGAFHDTVSYVTVAGKFVRGVALGGEGGLVAKFAGLGYQQVCGEAEVWGDFIVPQPCAHLEGATQVDLDGVFHSPLGEGLPAFGPWYGAPQVLDRWVHHMTGEPAPEGAATASADAAAVAVETVAVQ